MAIVDGLSKARMLEIEAQSVVDGEIVDRHLILTRHDGSTSDAGDVVGPPVTLVIAPKAVTDLPASYPTNITTFSYGATVVGWPAVLGTVFTYMENDQRGFQIVTEKATQKVWMRVVGANVWGNFFQLAGIDLATQIMTIPRLRLTSTNDASATSTQHAFQIGDDTAGNLIIDGNEIMSRNNGVGVRTFFEYGLNTDPAVFTPSADGDFVYKKITDTMRRGTIAQRLMTGGGLRKVSSAGISWSQRLMIMGAGRLSGSTNGYWEIMMPPDGTVIPQYGSTGGASVTVAGGVIPMTSWKALYYELPLTGNQVSQPGNFRMMDYLAATTQEIPAHWVLVAVRNVDSMSANYMWGDGRVQDYWRTMTLTNSWTAYNTSFPAPAWRFTHEGMVETRGLMKGGTVGLATPFYTLPDTAMAPEGGTNSGVIVTATASGGAGTCRLDILPDGKMSIVSMSVGTVNSTNAYVSLDNIRWHPAGH